MVSYSSISEALGAKADDMADLFLISRRTAYYLGDETMSMPANCRETFNNLRTWVKEAMAEPTPDDQSLPLDTSFRELLAAELVKITAVHKSLLKELADGVHIIKEETARQRMLNALPMTSPDPAEQKRLHEWRDRMVAISKRKVYKTDPKRIARLRIRIAKMEAEMEELNKLLSEK